MLYENPNAFLICRFRREQALCHRDGTSDAPRLDRCRPECGNVMRTDRHAKQLHERADLLEFRAATRPARSAIVYAATPPGSEPPPSTTTAPASHCRSPPHE
jgi:hypothetical protein